LSPSSPHVRRVPLALAAIAAVATLALGTSPGLAGGVTPQTATPTFATWSSEFVGTLGVANVEVTYDGPEFASTGPLDLSVTEFYNPPGSLTQVGLEYSIRAGSITFTFDAPVTNVAVYAYYFRTPDTDGPPAYALTTDGEGSWVRVSGDGLVAGSELLPGGSRFIQNILVFDGTITELTIGTVGDCTDCGSFQGLTLATLDTIDYPAPAATAVRPARGPATGGTLLTITGEGFFGDTAVTVGGAACTEVTVIDELTLTCAAPAGRAGGADVVVTTPGGTATAAGAFTYEAVPTPAPTPTPDAAPVAPTFTG